MWKEECKLFLVCRDANVKDSTLLDVSGYKNHAELSGCSFVTAHDTSNHDLVDSVDKNLRFPSGSSLRVSSAPCLEILDEITIEVWIKRGPSSRFESGFIVNHAGVVKFPQLANGRIEVHLPHFQRYFPRA